MILRSLLFVPGDSERFVLEEAIGPVPVRVEGGKCPMIWLTTPPIEVGRTFDGPACARALGLESADLLGVPPPESIAGVSLAPLMTGARATMDLEGYAEALYPLHHFGWADARAWPSWWRWTAARWLWRAAWRLRRTPSRRVRRTAAWWLWCAASRWRMMRSGELASPDGSSGAIARSHSRQGRRSARQASRRARRVGRTTSWLVPMVSERNRMRAHSRSAPRAIPRRSGTCGTRPACSIRRPRDASPRCSRSCG